jgi:hypothetical protein
MNILTGDLQPAAFCLESQGAVREYCAVEHDLDKSRRIYPDLFWFSVERIRVCRLHPCSSVVHCPSLQDKQRLAWSGDTCDHAAMAQLGSHSQPLLRPWYSLRRLPCRRGAGALGAMLLALGIVLNATFAAPVKGFVKMKQLDESGKLLQAEAACDRAIARLSETMDFQTIFDEMWVSDPELKERFFKHDLEEDKNDIPYDPTLAREAAIGTLNLIYMLFKYELDHPERPACLQRLLTSLDNVNTRLRSHHESRAAALKNLEQYVREARGVDRFLRERLMSEPRETAADKFQPADQDSRHKDKAEVLRGDTGLGLGEEIPVYSIVREGLRWDFIEERGAYRLVDIRWEIGGMGYL